MKLVSTEKSHFAFFPSMATDDISMIAGFCSVLAVRRQTDRYKREIFGINFRLLQDMIDTETLVIIIKMLFRCYSNHISSLTFILFRKYCYSRYSIIVNYILTILKNLLTH